MWFPVSVKGVRAVVGKCFRGCQERCYSQTVVETDHTTLSTIPPNSTIFSLIQPTGKIHLGNYFGAIKVWRQISDIISGSPLLSGNSKLIFGTADLHAITVPQEPSLLRERRVEAMASLLASGIDPKNVILFHQSSVPQHSELFWILSTFTSMGSLNRMTQFKSKAHIDERSALTIQETIGVAKLGLFAYPVLQAADILIYKSTHVPVGQDQTQHLELTRTIANSFNNFVKKEYFQLPKTLLAPSKKICSLKEPLKKMSKSDPIEQSKIMITEEPDSIRLKMHKAMTDSIEGKIYFDPVERPGISNLITIISAVTDKTIQEIVMEVEFFTKKELKDYTAELLIKELAEPRIKYNEYMKNTDLLNKIAKEGSERAKSIADVNLKEIKKLMGFL
ncbi:hypothetical protein PACTADRAFT_2095 [Pachysolen tannophilus NRRL Y-2460]|uniref:Tryptophan--tRNA ligase, mitochondrial n=1 Tax=Pachysolen tannophilus NRRL Y-2460 TaxID=669874 RepID=A0A1E4TVM1_PACTA|nr:hypothetical protein PACTADRAFT_2095 [Pachysolen tannophilus NRRL Y-2460]